MIGVRTKEALAAARARGVKLGGHREQSDITKAEAQQRAEGLRSVFEELSGLSARKAAEEREPSRHSDCYGAQVVRSTGHQRT